MLPIKWSQPPCINMELSIVKYTEAESCGVNSTDCINSAGMYPYWTVNNWKPREPSMTEYKKTSVLAAISPTVTYGLLIAGTSSLIGINKSGSG